MNDCWEQGTNPFKFNIQRAEDFYMRRRFEYYVLHSPTMSDQEFDRMEGYFKVTYPQSPVFGTVGSDSMEDYPPHIQEGRRPLRDERRWPDDS